MVTFLDTGLLNYFQIIFPALLVFVIIYGLFQKLKIFGDSKSIHAIAALAIAFMVLLSEDIVNLIGFIAPWFVVFFIFVVLLLMVYKIMGASDAELAKSIMNDEAIIWTVFIIGFIIVAAGIATVFGPRLVPLTGGNQTLSTNGSFGETVGQVIFHPKVIGLIFILLVATFTIGLLTKEV